jgi:ABC-type branched-subunit amino acid transport system ATPase component
MILAVRDVCAGYGTAPVLRNISFTQQHGEVLGIVGHNGMGKTTLLRTIVGLLQTASGAIEFDGEPIEDMPAYRRSSAGIGYVPQGNLGFPDLSVAENLELAHERPRSHLTIEAVVSLFPRLAELLDRRSAALSGGKRQLLSIARAVIRFPRLLLLDEMTEGIQPSIVEEIAERLRNLHDQLGMTMLIVDQELAFVATLASRVLVMQKGQLRQAFGVANPRSVRRRLTVLQGGTGAEDNFLRASTAPPAGNRCPSCSLSRFSRPHWLRGV